MAETGNGIPLLGGRRDDFLDHLDLGVAFVLFVDDADRVENILWGRVDREIDRSDHQQGKALRKHLAQF